MIYSLIEYRIKEPSKTWESEVVPFIEAIDGDPSLRGRISYRCLKQQDGVSFCHFAAASDESAVEELKRRPFFKPYSERLRAVAESGPKFTKVAVIGGTAVQL